jgi:uncharacterized protein
MSIITGDMRAVIEAAHLCFAATVTPEGWPNLSPKGTVRVWDDDRLFFLDIASPRTRANLTHNSAIVVNVVDQLSRRGYRFEGTARLETAGPVFDTATRRVFDEEGTTYPVEAVVLIAVEQAEPLVSPGYWHVRDEHSMRDAWKVRRPLLEAAFEEHIRLRGPISASDANKEMA